MFDAVRNNKRIVQIFLILITLPFAFWGVESYVRNVGAGRDAASVGRSKISPQELGRALREQQDRMRAALGRDFNPAMFDTPEVRQAVLDSLISQRLLLLRAAKSNLTAGDDQVREVIGGILALQENGQFSMARYEALLRNQGMNRTGFEAQLRQDLVVQQMVASVGDSALVSRAASDRWLALQQEEREISELAIRPESFVTQVQLAADVVKNFYDANSNLFELPEQARAEYVILSQDVLAEQLAVSEAEIKSWYDSHQDSYKQSEERRASHILIQASKDAGTAERDAARAKIEDIQKQLKQSPADFAKLAKQHSQDPGSAQNGGDLGFFSRGAMVKPFEDAAFALKENQLSDIVLSDFGYHIIKVTGVRPEKIRSLDEVKGEITAELKRQGAGRKYAEAAETFANLVYEQADSLKPAAEKFGLPLKQTDWIAKGAAQSAGPLAHEKMLAALFSEDAIKNKRNTEAIEVAPNNLVAARVIEHKPASMRPLDAVSGEIKKQLVLDEAGKLAQKEGEDKLARLAKGEKVDTPWSAPRVVTRQGSPETPPQALQGIFKVAADKLPGYSGTRLPNGVYVVYRVTSVRQPAAKEDAHSKQLRAQYARMKAEDDFSAYLSALKETFPVTINKAVLEAKER
jgi:peptidyl-prolyl cis-trans isomerase D